MWRFLVHVWKGNRAATACLPVTRFSSTTRLRGSRAHLEDRHGHQRQSSCLIVLVKNQIRPYHHGSSSTTAASPGIRTRNYRAMYALTSTSSSRRTTIGDACRTSTASNSNHNNNTTRQYFSSSSSSPLPTVIPMDWTRIIRHFPILVALATMAAFTTTSSPLWVMAEQQQMQEDPEKMKHILLAKDVYYDVAVEEALFGLREVSRAQVESGERVLPHALQPASNTKGNNNKKGGERERLDMATLTLMGYKGGPAESQINQDRAFCMSDFGNDSRNKLLGVFDGHAKHGERVSQYVVTELPKRLESKLSEVLDNANPQQGGTTEMDDKAVQRALSETFIELDRTAPAHPSGGCTATVILKLGSKVFVANAGDSQSFLVVYRASSKQVSVIYITREDKPELPDERARIEAAGGTVYIPVRPGGTSRVLYFDSFTGHQSGLAMSRSIGDWDAGRLGVVADPIVDVLDLKDVLQSELFPSKRKNRRDQQESCIVIDGDGQMHTEFCSSIDDNNDERRNEKQQQVVVEDDVYIFAVSATDGVMDFVDAKTVAHELADSLYGSNGVNLWTACERIVWLAANSWHQAKGGRYRDDIALAVSTIREPPSSSSS